jgi:hypothetical protein
LTLDDSGCYGCATANVVPTQAGIQYRRAQGGPIRRPRLDSERSSEPTIRNPAFAGVTRDRTAAALSVIDATLAVEPLHGEN